MKKLEFEIFERDGLFTVHLGSGEWLRFENLTKAKTFIRAYKNVMTDNVSMLNLMQPQINSFYRQNIMSLDPKTQRLLAQELQTFDKYFEMIFHSFSSGNRNAFIFANIRTCLDSLMSATQLLYSYAKRYKHYGLKASVIPVIKNLEMVSRQVDLDKKSLFIDNGYKRSKVLTLSDQIQNEKISS